MWTKFGDSSISVREVIYDNFSPRNARDFLADFSTKLQKMHFFG